MSAVALCARSGGIIWGQKMKRMMTSQFSKRLDWRDPDMPVIRAYRFQDDCTRIEFDPEYERRYREHMMQVASQPSWRKDPTYNLKRKHRAPPI